MPERYIKTHPLIESGKLSLVERQVSLDALTQIETSLSKTKGLLKEIRES